MSAFALVVHLDGSEIADAERRSMRAGFSHRSEVLRETDIRPNVYLLTSNDDSFELPAAIMTSGESGSCLLSPSPSESARPPKPSALLAPTPLVSELSWPFLCLVWDRSEVRIFVDELATRVAWFSHSGQTVVVGSEPRMVLNHPEASREVDLGVLAERLAYRPSTPNRSVYAALQAIPSGSWLSIGSSGLRCREWKHWRFEPDDSIATADWQQRVHDLTRDIVGQQLGRFPDQRAAILLSGGLDSSVLAGVVRELGLDSKTLAVGCRYPGLPCDESSFQDAVLEGTQFESKFVNHRPLDFERDVFGVIQASELPLSSVEPEADDAAQWMSSVGVHRRVSGVGGDELFLAYGDRTVDFVRDRRWGAALQSARGQSIVDLARSNASWLPPRVRARYRSSHLPAWVDAGFARSIGLADRIEVGRELAGQRGLAHSRLDDLTSSGWSGVVSEMSENGRARLRAEPLNPFLDPELIELMLNVPDRCRSDAGDSRRFQRETYADILPPALLERRGKVHFDYRHAIDLGHPAIVSLFQSLELEKAGLVDGEIVRSMHTQLMGAVRSDIRSIPALAGRLWMIAGHELWWRSITSKSQ